MNLTPGKPLIYAVLALSAIATVELFILKGGHIYWLISGTSLLAISLFDMLKTRRLKSPEVKRIMAHNLPLDVNSSVKLRLHNRESVDLNISLYDHHPSHFITQDMPQQLELPAHKRLETSYLIKPPKRGDASFPFCEIQIQSPFSLWQHKRLLPVESHVRVFPNFAEISHYTLLATDNRLSQIGIKKRQRRGEGNEFFQLREFRQGDSQRLIHWQASARLRKLISKDYQEEKDQQVIFMLDCGRRMRHKDDHRAHLDQALNAILLLGYVAVRQGDAIGMLSMGADNRWLPPRKGEKAVNHILEAMYDLHATIAPADYLESTSRFHVLQRRRALVILITNTRNEDYKELMTAVKLLKRDHLVVVADLREEILNDSQEARIESLDSAIRYHAVEQYLHERRQQHRMLSHYGVMTLDITARELPVALVNQYLEVKRGAVL